MKRLHQHKVNVRSWAKALRTTQYRPGRTVKLKNGRIDPLGLAALKFGLENMIGDFAWPPQIFKKVFGLPNHIQSMVIIKNDKMGASFEEVANYLDSINRTYTHCE